MTLVIKGSLEMMFSTFIRFLSLIGGVVSQTINKRQFSNKAAAEKWRNATGPGPSGNDASSLSFVR